MRARGVVLVALAAAGSGCGAPAGPCDDTGPDFTCDRGAAAVRTAELWAAVINPDCVTVCHRPGGSAVSYGDYSTATVFQNGTVGAKSLYAGSKGTLKRVDPDALQNSSVWLKVVGGAPAGKKGPQCEGVGNAMPDGPGPLSELKKKQLKDWICGGARE